MSTVNGGIKAVWLDETHLDALTEFREACGGDWDDYVNFEPDDVEDFEEYFVGLVRDDEIIGLCTVGYADVYDTIRSGLHGGHASAAVPIDVPCDPLSGDVFAVLHIKAAVIVPWIVGPVFAGSSVVPCQFQTVFIRPFQSCFAKSGEAASA